MKHIATILIALALSVTGALAQGTGGGGVGQNSVTAGQFGPLTQCAVTAGTPTYTTGRTDPLSCTTGGLLRVDASGGGAATTVVIIPSSSSNAGLAPVVSAAAESSHVLKASPGNLYSVSVTIGGTAGYLLMFDATSAPVDGAVTPTQCVIVPASATVAISFDPAPPEVYATGITAVFSTTGCFTKTASATAFFHGSVD